MQAESQHSGGEARSGPGSSRGGSDFLPDHLAQLHDSKQELILKVQALKKVGGCLSACGGPAARMS